MTDAELKARVYRTEWKTPFRKLICLVFHRKYWRYYFDWETATLTTGVVNCDKCEQYHALAADIKIIGGR